MAARPGPPGVLFVAACLALAVLASAPAVAQDLPGLPGRAPEPPAPARSLPVESSPAADRAIAERLREIFAQVERLEAVGAEVRAGVVELSGEVPTGAAGAKARGIARQLQGVVEVQSVLEEVRDLERRLRPALADLRERGLDLLARLPLSAVALLVFVAVAAPGPGAPMR